MAEMPNGAPYQDIDESPNGALLGEELAQWLYDTFGGGSTQQVLTADQSQDAKVAFRYPKARTATGLPVSGEAGALVMPTEGAVATEMHWWTGAAWVRVMRHVDVSQFALGEHATVTKGGAPTNVPSIATWTDVAELSITTTLSASRKYVAHAAVAAAITFGSAGQRSTAYARVLYGSTHVGMIMAYDHPTPLTTGQGVDLLGEARTRPFVGTGVSGTIKVQAQKTHGAGLTVGSEIIDTDFLAFLVIEDVGPA